MLYMLYQKADRIAAKPSSAMELAAGSYTEKWKIRAKDTQQDSRRKTQEKVKQCARETQKQVAGQSMQLQAREDHL